MDIICFMIQSPLYAAASNGHTTVVDLLLIAGADANKVSHYTVCMCPPHTCNHFLLLALNT